MRTRANEDARPGVIRRALGSAPGAGAVTLASLFAVDLASASLAFMGYSDAHAFDIIIARYRSHIVWTQVEILGVFLVVGGLLGGAGAAIGRLWDWARMRTTSRRRSTVRAVLAALVGHSFLLARHVVHYPQLYVESFYDRGGARRAIMTALTDHLSLRALDGLAVAALGFALLGPFMTAVGRARLLAWVAERKKQRVPRRRVAIAFGVTALLAGTAFFWPRHHGAAQAAGPRAHGPNLLLIAVDSLRADRVFAPDAATRFPALARLATRGVRFREAHVTVARTFPSFVTLLTGRWPHHHGIRHMFPSAEARKAIGPSLPSTLAQAGYRTAVVSDYAGEIFSRTPLGFEEIHTPYFDMGTIVDQRGLQVHPNVLPYATSTVGRVLFPAVDALAERSDPDLLADRAIATLRNLKGQPFFLTVFFSVAHFPYAAPAPWYRRYTSPAYDGPYRYEKPPLAPPPASDEDARQIHALYDGAVAAADAAIGRLLASLEAAGLADDTIVVLLADHGENLYDRPGRGMGHGDHLLGSAADHVPLVIVDPRHRFAAHDVGSLTRDIDVTPTLAALLGVPAPPSDGVDLGPLLRGERASLDLDGYEETEFWFTDAGPGFQPDERLPYPGITGATDLAPDGDIFIKPEWQDTIIAAKHRALRSGRWKLIYRPTRHGAEWMLYDLAADPDETHDVASAQPQVLAQLRKKLEAWMTADGRAVMRGGFAVPR